MVVSAVSVPCFLSGLTYIHTPDPGFIFDFLAVVGCSLVLLAAWLRCSLMLMVPVAWLILACSSYLFRLSNQTFVSAVLLRLFFTFWHVVVLLAFLFVASAEKKKRSGPRD